MKKTLLLLVSTLLPAILWAQTVPLSTTALKALINTNLSTSTRGDITPAKIKIVLTALADAIGNQSTTTPVYSGATASPFVPLFVFYGESNAAGATSNSGLAASELLVRPSVKVINNTTLTLQSLQIGINNYQDALGVTSAMHGWEASLANATEAGLFYNNPVYLVKAGQGGASVSLLASGGSYWNKLSARVDSMKANIRRAGKIPITYVVYSQGINDKNANTDITTWKVATQALFKALRGKLGYVPIIATQFSSTYSDYNTAYAQMQTTDPFLFMVDVSGTTYQDAYHWDAPSMKTIGARMWNIVTNTIGQNQAYQLSQTGALAGATPTSTGTGGGSGTTVSPGTSPSCVTTTVVASWTQLTNMSVTTGTKSGAYVASTASGNIPTGATATTQVNASCFEIIMQQDAASIITLYVDDTYADTYATGRNIPIGGMFVYSDGVPYSYVGTTFTARGSAVTFPCKVRLVGNGTDLVYSTSTDDGSTWTTRYTGAGALTGKTSLWVKLLPTNTGNNKAQVTIGRP